MTTTMTTPMSEGANSTQATGGLSEMTVGNGAEKNVDAVADRDGGRATGVRGEGVEKVVGGGVGRAVKEPLPSAIAGAASKKETTEDQQLQQQQHQRGELSQQEANKSRNDRYVAPESGGGVVYPNAATTTTTTKTTTTTPSASKSAASVTLRPAAARSANAVSGGSVGGVGSTGAVIPKDPNRMSFHFSQIELRSDMEESCDEVSRGNEY